MNTSKAKTYEKSRNHCGRCGATVKKNDFCETCLAYFRLL